jgi:hypothetical protein
MTQMEVAFATFESELDAGEVEETMLERAEKFREVEGLVQKFYFHDAGNDRFGAFFIFESEASRDAYFAGVSEAYAVSGEPDVTTGRMLFPLREAEGLPKSA